MRRMKLVSTLGIIGSIATFGSASAMPVLTNTAAVKAALSDDVSQVQWRGSGWGFGAAALGGFALGALTAPLFAGPGFYGASYPYGYGSYAWGSPYRYSSYGWGSPYRYSGFGGWGSPYYRSAAWGFPGFGFGYARASSWGYPSYSGWGGGFGSPGYASVGWGSYGGYGYSGYGGGFRTARSYYYGQPAIAPRRFVVRRTVRASFASANPAWVGGRQVIVNRQFQGRQVQMRPRGQVRTGYRGVGTLR